MDLEGVGLDVGDLVEQRCDRTHLGLDRGDLGREDLVQHWCMYVDLDLGCDPADLDLDLEDLDLDCVDLVEYRCVRADLDVYLEDRDLGDLVG